MKNKNDRLQTIRQVVIECKIGSQEELLKELLHRGYTVTQATLSRDLKRLKITKTLDNTGEYRYRLTDLSFISEKSENNAKALGANSLEFSGPLAVMKTRSGYAGAIAAEIDQHAGEAVLGTIAGDDTILIIPREGFSRVEITNILSNLIENLS
ncbi:MAG: ArgR family transcriptional regulator [Paludibacteraceae bacterium]|nr:ArgR family transcriptional regulator [Paludibacteraceae bacterium]